MSEEFFECSVLFTTILFAAEGDDGEPCRWLEDAAELRERWFKVEPVESTAHGDHVHGCGGEAGGLGGSID